VLVCWEEKKNNKKTRLIQRKDAEAVGVETTHVQASAKKTKHTNYASSKKNAVKITSGPL